MNTIKFELTAAGIQITIPTDLLKHVAESNTEFPLIVHDEKDFAASVMDKLEHSLGNPNATSTNTGFQELIDEACWAVFENDEDCVSSKESGGNEDDEE